MLDKLYKRTVKVNDCMVWSGAINTDGYPRISYRGDCNVKVHRLVYELTHDINITGKVIRHICDNPLCINPDHLLLGTPKENVEDRKLRGRSHNHVSNEEKEQVVGLRFLGLKFKEISQALNIAVKRVEYILTLTK
jgi:hypothetical protein